MKKVGISFLAGNSLVSLGQKPSLLWSVIPLAVGLAALSLPFGSVSHMHHWLLSSKAKEFTNPQESASPGPPWHFAGPQGSPLSLPASAHMPKADAKSKRTDEAAGGLCWCLWVTAQLTHWEVIPPSGFDYSLSLPGATWGMVIGEQERRWVL